MVLALYSWQDASENSDPCTKNTNAHLTVSFFIMFDFFLRTEISWEFLLLNLLKNITKSIRINMNPSCVSFQWIVKLKMVCILFMSLLHWVTLFFLFVGLDLVCAFYGCLYIGKFLVLFSFSLGRNFVLIYLSCLFKNNFFLGQLNLFTDNMIQFLFWTFSGPEFLSLTYFSFLL